MNVHILKCWPQFFGPISASTKRYEIRKDDREYTVGDVLDLREWDPNTGAFTGNQVSRIVTTLMRDFPGLQPGFVLMSIMPQSEEYDVAPLLKHLALADTRANLAYQSRDRSDMLVAKMHAECADLRKQMATMRVAFEAQSAELARAKVAEEARDRWAQQAGENGARADNEKARADAAEASIAEERRLRFIAAENANADGAAYLELKKTYEAKLTELSALTAKRDALQNFKAFVHTTLDTMRVPGDPFPQETAEHGCRIGGRLKYLQQTVLHLRDQVQLREDSVAERTLKARNEMLIHVSAERDHAREEIGILKQELAAAKDQLDQQCKAGAKYREQLCDAESSVSLLEEKARLADGRLTRIEELARENKRLRDAAKNAERWEDGFRNIVTFVVGARTPFEIADIVEAVRKLAGCDGNGDPISGKHAFILRSAHEAAMCEGARAIDAIRVLHQALGFTCMEDGGSPATIDARIVNVAVTHIEELRKKLQDSVLAAKEALGDFATPPFSGSLADSIRMRGAAAAARVKELEALSVTNIMLSVEPGPHGEGVEVYATSVQQVEEALAEARDQADDATNGAVGLQDLHITPTGVDAQLALAKGLVERFAQAFLPLLVGADNYVECHLTGADGKRVIFTIQRPEGKTPHELRQAAEARVKELEAQLPVKPA